MSNKVISFPKDDTSSSNMSQAGSSIDPAGMVYKDITTKGKNTVTSHVNARAVKGSIRNILNFRQGERVLNPEFGNTLHRLLYEGINKENNERIGTTIKEFFLKNEPRVVIDHIRHVQTDNETDNNIVHVLITYHIIGLEGQTYSEDLIENIS